jgi:hypothetical protein
MYYVNSNFSAWHFRFTLRRNVRLLFYSYNIYIMVYMEKLCVDGFCC